MNLQEKIDRSRPMRVKESDKMGLREEPGYEIWFSLAEDRVWKLGGALAAVFVGLATVGALGAIAVSLAT